MRRPRRSLSCRGLVQRGLSHQPPAGDTTKPHFPFLVAVRDKLGDLSDGDGLTLRKFIPVSISTT